MIADCTQRMCGAWARWELSRVKRLCTRAEREHGRSPQRQHGYRGERGATDTWTCGIYAPRHSTLDTSVRATCGPRALAHRERRSGRRRVPCDCGLSVQRLVEKAAHLAAPPAQCACASSGPNAAQTSFVVCSTPSINAAGTAQWSLTLPIWHIQIVYALRSVIYPRTSH